MLKVASWLTRKAGQTLRISKSMGRSARKVGLPPGSLIYTGEERKAPVEITIIDYDEANVTEKKVERIEECFPFKETNTVTWINIDGVHDVSVLEGIGKRFDVHPLVLEDIMNAGLRPKVEDHGSHVFIILRMLRYDEQQSELLNEQVSLIVGPNFVISFQEQANGDVFGPVRERIRSSKGRIRRSGPDYLAYALMDIIVDNYFVILEAFGEEIELIEAELMRNPDPNVHEQINRHRKEITLIRKAIWPLREVVHVLHREESSIFTQETLLYLRDVYDHTIEVIETIETLRDSVGGLLDVYLSSVSYKMNEVMKVLTIIATIFIPLTFIAGIYGMNFRFMPELDTHWGYPLALVVMTVIAIGMLIYFRRKRWL